MNTCNAWAPGHGYCAQPTSKRYLGGWRCAAHTPAAFAGRPDVTPDPALTLYGRLAAAASQEGQAA